MKRAIGLVALLAFAGAVGVARADDDSARAELHNASGEMVGTAEMTQTSDGVKITLDVSHLSPGMHAFHIHGTGKCDAPDFKSAGGHFNPEGKEHGMKNPKGHHAGDMANFEADANGSAHVEVLNTAVTLEEGKNSLFQPNGTAFVIHEKADDEMSDPAGNAGGRVACGVIEASEGED
jgi:superoxide dismutase, Cu-Zn family